MTARAARWLLAAAAVIVVVFLATHLAGLRESTSWLCRIDVSVRPGFWELAGLLLYLVCYAGLLFVAPILALAAVLLFLYDRLRRSLQPGRQTHHARTA
jgi:hypothetical protein